MPVTRKPIRGVAVLAAAVASALPIVDQANATIYTDTTAEVLGNNAHLDISSVEVTNDANNLTFTITLVGNIASTNWGRYKIAIDRLPGEGVPAPNDPWQGQLAIVNEMDAWVGSWVTAGGGAELHLWDTPNTVWGPVVPGTSAQLTPFSTTIVVPLAPLGLSVGNSFNFDVYSTGAFGTDPALDASSNPEQTVAVWQASPYDSNTAGPGGTPLVSSYTVVGTTQITGQWTGTEGTNWSAAGNWTGGVPANAGDVANFGAISTTNYAVAIDGGPRTVGTVNFDNATNSYTLGVNGGNALIMENLTGNGQINVINGAHTIAAPVTLNDNVTIDVFNATDVLTLSGGMNAAGRVVNKAGAGLLRVDRIRAQALNVGGSGTLQLSVKSSTTDPNNVTVVNQLNIAEAFDVVALAALDITNNTVIVDYTGISPAGTLTAQMKNAYNGGLWNQLGLTTSVPVITSGPFAGKTAAIGIVEASSLSPVPPTYYGQPIDSTTVLIKYTLPGDSDVDGDVDLDDVGRWSLNFTGELGGVDATKLWAEGDWDYDGDVDLDDVGDWSLNFTGELGGSGLGSTGQTLYLGDAISSVNPQALAALQSMGITVVPEPSAALAALGVCLAGAATRRSRIRR